MAKPKTQYTIISTMSQVKKLVRCCRETKYAAYDFETTGVRIYDKSFYPTILGISFEPGSAIIVPLGHFESPLRPIWKKVLKYIGKHIMQDESIVKIAWNEKFDSQIFRKYGTPLKGRRFDAMLAKYILDEQRPHGLKDAVRRYLPQFGDYEEDYEGCNLPWDKKPLEGLSQYCGIDCDMALRLFLFLEKKLMDLGFYSLYRNLICPASNLLERVEARGQLLDADFHGSLMEKYPRLIQEAEDKVRAMKKVRRFEKDLIQQRLEKYQSSIEEEIEELESKIEKETEPRKISSMKRSITTRETKLAKIQAREFTSKKELSLLEPINFGSTQQMTQLLFTSDKGFKFEIVKYTQKDKKDTDNPSAAEDVLLELQKIDKTGFIGLLLELRGLKQINNMFVKGFANLVQDDGKLHPKFKIQGTVSGRLSSCISETSLLSTNKGLIPIGDLVPDGEGYNEISNLMVKTHNNRYKPIKKGINKGVEMMYLVTLEDGKEVECTLKHKFITEYGEKTIEEMMGSDNPTVTIEDFNDVRIISVYPIGPRKVCDIEVEEDHTYFANGILHHNSEPNAQQFPRLACLGAGEKITTNLGDIPIETLCPSLPGTQLNEHKLLVYTHNKRYMPVEAFVNKGKSEMFKVTFETGEVVNCTMDHIFYTNKGFIPLRDVLEDEHIKILAYDKDEIGSD